MSQSTNNTSTIFSSAGKQPNQTLYLRARLLVDPRHHCDFLHLSQFYRLARHTHTTLFVFHRSPNSPSANVNHLLTLSENFPGVSQGSSLKEMNSKLSSSVWNSSHLLRMRDCALNLAWRPSSFFHIPCHTHVTRTEILNLSRSPIQEVITLSSPTTAPPSA